MMSVNLHDVVIVVLDGDCSSLAVHDVGCQGRRLRLDVLDVADVLPTVLDVDVVSSCPLMMFII